MAVIIIIYRETTMEKKAWTEQETAPVGKYA